MEQELIAKNWRELIRPRELEAQSEDPGETYGRFACEPLERGFGVTLGNALRRILLSSLQGASITSVRIEGVLHEFSSIPGVIEDMSDIVLNLKEVRLRLHSEGPKSLRIHKKGPGLLTAGDLVLEDSGVDVLNPTHKIATLSGDADVELEITIGTGKGYVRAEMNKTEDMPIGVIPIDSVFSPVQKVNYTVTNARVGQETDYDKLVIEIWTDGSVEPADALAFAAKILKDQLRGLGTGVFDRQKAWHVRDIYLPAAGIVDLRHQADISQPRRITSAIGGLFKPRQQRLERLQSGADEMLHPGLGHILASAAELRGMAGNGEVADRVQVHRDGLRQRQRLGTLCRGIGEEVQLAGLVQIIQDCQGLRQPQPVDLQHRHKALRVARQMFGAALLSLYQIDRDGLVFDPGKVQRDAQPVAGRRPPVIKKHHIRHQSLPLVPA